VPSRQHSRNDARDRRIQDNDYETTTPIDASQMAAARSNSFLEQALCRAKSDKCPEVTDCYETARMDVMEAIRAQDAESYHRDPSRNIAEDSDNRPRLQSVQKGSNASQISADV
jgi:hypothetical protein